MSATRMAGRVRSGQAPCVLCGDRAANVGVWPPDPETRRLFNTTAPIRVVDALCQACLALPDPGGRIEDLILTDVAALQ